MKLRTSVVAVAALALLALPACGSDDETSTEAPSTSGNTVAVTLRDYAIEPAVTSGCFSVMRCHALG